MLTFRIFWLFLQLHMMVLCVFLCPFLKVDQWWSHHNDEVYKELKKIFPETKEKEYTILQIALEQFGFSQNALVQTSKSAQEWELWYLLPFSVSPPPRSIFKSTSNFQWLATQDMRIVVILLSEKLVVLEQTQMQKGSLGSWHERQTFPYICDRLSMSADGKLIIISGQSVLYVLKLISVNPAVYDIQRIMMDHWKTDFQMCTTGLNNSYFFTSNPFCMQTDGMMAVYQVSSAELKFFQILNPPDRAGFFGAHVILKSNFLFVGAPLANKGRGCIYVYRMDPTISLFCTIELFSRDDQLTGDRFSGNDQVETQEFGRKFKVSENGEYVVVVSNPATVSIFQKMRDLMYYTHKQNIRLQYSCGRQISVDIDNNGTVLVSDKYNVYYYAFDTNKGFNFVIGTQHSKKAKLSYVSPNRLRIQRGLQMHKRSISLSTPTTSSISTPQNKISRELFSIPEKVNLESLHHVTKKLGLDGISIGVVK